MPSKVTLAYSHRLVQRLVDDKKLALAPDVTVARAADALAEALTGLPQHAGLISNTTKALVASPLVDEFYVTDDELQEIVNSLRT